MNNNGISFKSGKVVDPNGPRKVTSMPVTQEVPMQNMIDPKTMDIPRNIPPVNTLPEGNVGMPPITEWGYIPYYLTRNIGRNVRAEFIVGSNQYVDKTGRLSEVGISYFVLEDVTTDTKVMCDLYSVKFVTIAPN